LIRLVPDPSLLLPEFLTVYLNTPFGIGQVRRRAMRSINQANVSGSEIRKVSIPLPDIQIQAEVAVLVNGAFSKQQESLHKHHEAQELFKQNVAFDATSGSTRNQQFLSCNTAMLTDIFAANRIDANCFGRDAMLMHDCVKSSRNFDRLSDLVTNAWKGMQQHGAVSGDISYCSIKHISGREVVSESFTNYFSGMPIAKRGDMLLAITGATIGKLGLVRRYDRIAFSGDLLAMKPNESVPANYLLFVLNCYVGQVQLKRWITGSTNGHLAPRDAGKILVPRVASSVEMKIATLVEEAFSARTESEKLLCQAKNRVEQLTCEAVE